MPATERMCGNVHTAAAGGAILVTRLLHQRSSMGAGPVFPTTAPGRLLGVLRSLQGWTRALRGPPEDVPTPTAVLAAHAYGLVRVLVVDDNPVNLMLISAMLEPRRIVPLLAADGVEAVAVACLQQFDLILMDLQMPILGGLEATSAIRRVEAATSRLAVPVVAYSFVRPEAAVLARHGMSGSLSKPCSDQELEDCLVRWCPTYRSAPTVTGAVQGIDGVQAARRDRESPDAALR